MTDYVKLSHLSYDVDKFVRKVEDSEDLLDTISDRLTSNPYYEPNLQLLDYFSDPSGVSGSAFEDTRTGEVIISYTGSNELKDWGNNIAGAGLAIYDYCIPAYDFYEKVQKKYGSKITLTGHSQGGGIAQRVAIEYNVQKTIVVNPSPLAIPVFAWGIEGLINAPYYHTQLENPHLSFPEPLYQSKMNIINEKINHFSGRVLRIRSEGDILNASAQLVGGRYLGDEYRVKDGSWHLLHELLASKELLAEVNQAVQGYFLPELIVDFDQDGISDIDKHVIHRMTRNLITNSEVLDTSHPISVNVAILQQLSENLTQRIHSALSEVSKICDLCIRKNEQVAQNFETRKHKVSSAVYDALKSAGLSALIYHLKDSIEVMIQHQSLFRRGSHYFALENPFEDDETIFLNGRSTYAFTQYDLYLIRFSEINRQLTIHITQERTNEPSFFISQEQTLLGSWQVVESASKRLVQESEAVFQGEGLRSGKTDGIPQSLARVLAVIQKNTTELHQSLNSAVEFIQRIAQNFEEADTWLGKQLQQGQFIGEVPVPTVPRDYKAYLERDEIFDDVKDVLQAFDKQVEQNSRQYARKVAQVYSDVMGNFEQGLERWHTLSLDLRQAVVAVTENYDVSVHVKEEVMVEKKVGEQIIQETNYPVHYWGRLERLYPGEVTEMIRQLKSRLLPKIESIQQAIWKSNRVKNQLQYMESPLKPIVEEGVYQAFDLDEIIKGQQQVIQFIRRLEQEIGHVAQVIIGEGMAAKSIETLQQKLFDTQRLLKYYTRFVSDCFGNNEYSGTNNTIPTRGSKFSLNTTMF